MRKGSQRLSIELKQEIKDYILANPELKRQNIYDKFIISRRTLYVLMGELKKEGHSVRRKFQRRQKEKAGRLNYESQRMKENRIRLDNIPNPTLTEQVLEEVFFHTTEEQRERINRFLNRNELEIKDSFNQSPSIMFLKSESWYNVG